MKVILFVFLALNIYFLRALTDEENNLIAYCSGVFHGEDCFRKYTTAQGSSNPIFAQKCENDGFKYIKKFIYVDDEDSSKFSTEYYQYIQANGNPFYCIKESECPIFEGYYIDDDTNACLECSTSFCKECPDNKCKQCQDNYFLHLNVDSSNNFLNTYDCLDTCPPGYYCGQKF